MKKLVAIAENITLENVKKSNYWDLISILVWNHYSEKKYQKEDDIEIEEDWYGKAEGGSSHGYMWQNEDYKQEGYVRTLGSINIIFKRTDYVTYIHIRTNGNVFCFGSYTDTEKSNKRPNYDGAQRNLDISNWLFQNNFIGLR